MAAHTHRMQKNEQLTNYTVNWVLSAAEAALRPLPSPTIWVWLVVLAESRCAITFAALGPCPTFRAECASTIMRAS